jgi:hypothetical protein
VNLSVAANHSADELSRINRRRRARTEAGRRSLTTKIWFTAAVAITVVAVGCSSSTNTPRTPNTSMSPSDAYQQGSEAVTAAGYDAIKQMIMNDGFIPPAACVKLLHDAKKEGRYTLQSQDREFVDGCQHQIALYGIG